MIITHPIYYLSCVLYMFLARQRNQLGTAAAVRENYAYCAIIGYARVTNFGGAVNHH